MRNSTGGRRRRAVAVGATLLALAALGAAPSGCGGSRAAERYRGVVVVVLDTVRADHSSALGYPAPTTPALARLAAAGRTYERCWSPASWTSPAHASLFTGQLPDRHGLRRSNSMSLPAGAETLAGRLSAAGFATAGFSGNPNASGVVALDQGFQHFELLPGDATMGVPLAPGAAGYSRQIADRALDWIRKCRGERRRHFAFVNLFDAHIPYDPPLRAAEPFTAGVPFELVEWGRRLDHPFPMAYALGLAPLSSEQLGVLARLYDGEIATADDALGSLLSGLDALGARDDTLVVVLADHGENLGDHGLLSHMLGVDASLLHVPLVVRAPGVLDDGGRSRELVRVEDVAPTILDLCGLLPFSAPDGVSILDDVGPRVSLAWLDPMLPGQIDAFRDAFPGVDLGIAATARRSVFDGRFHLIFEDGRPRRLYDVDEDPREVVDVAAARPGDVERLRALLQQHDEAARASGVRGKRAR